VFSKGPFAQLDGVLLGDLFQGQEVLREQSRRDDDASDLEPIYQGRELFGAS
jgi:hypothetical protein